MNKNIIISIDAENAFEENQYPYMKKKPFSKLGIKGNYLKLIKRIHKKSTANFILYGE